jgi:predicted RND superfamily exporter protein
MRSLATLLVRKPRTVLLIFTIITIVVGLFAQNLYMESNLSGFLPKDTPELKDWDKIVEDFHMGSTIIVYIESLIKGYDIRHPDVLDEMNIICTVDEKELDKGKIDGIIKINSVSNLIKEEHSENPLIGDLGGGGERGIPSDESTIRIYFSRPSLSATKGILYTNDYKIAVILVQISEDADYDKIIDDIQYLIEHRSGKLTEMTITGTLAMQKAIQKTSMEQLILVFPIAIILVSFVLLYFHRSFKGIIIAFLPPAYALILTFGTLGVVNPKLTLISVSVVALLMGLGVDYSIHLMNRFAEEISIDDKIDRIEKILRSTGKAILLSTITTMIGFGSLMISSMSPMVSFGFACVIGILYCFVSAIILVPCLVLILKFEKKIYVSGWKKFAKFAVDNRRRVIVIAVFFAVMSLILLPYVKTDVNYSEMAPEGISELKALRAYSENFGSGSNFNAFYLDVGPQGLTYPETIDAIYKMEEKMRKIGIKEGILKDGLVVYSVADEIKKVNDILKKNEIIDELAKHYGVDKVLFDQIADEGLISEDYSKTIVIVSIPIGLSIEKIEILINEINEIIDETRLTLPRGRYISHVTGQDAINVAIDEKLADEQARSMVIALLLVLAALIIIFNSSLYGFLTMIPVVFVLIWEPGFLVGFSIPLSVTTISIASIMIGIGIDYGVHITHRVREEMANGLSNVDATKVAIEKTGLSLVEAALTTVAGLASIYFVGVPAMQEFGLVVILMTSLSCVAAVLILPTFFSSRFLK